MKNGEIYHFWAKFGDRYRYPFGAVPVPLWSGTGTADAVAKRNWYRSKSVPVSPSRTEPVPVPMAPTAPVFVIFAYLS